MTHRLFLIPVFLGLSVGSAFACPWAGGSYSFKEVGVYGELAVNADCTEMNWKRLKEPETVPLERTNEGWKARLKRVDVVLLENGKSLRIFDGGVMRQATVTPKG